MAEGGNLPKMVKRELSFEGVNYINKKKQEGVMQRKHRIERPRAVKQPGMFEGIEGILLFPGLAEEGAKEVGGNETGVGGSQYANIRSLNVMLKAMGSH